MADALLRPHVVEALDAEALDELPPQPLGGRRLDVLGGDDVVVEDDHPLRVGDLDHVRPLVGHEAHVQRHDRVHPDDHHVARPDAVAAGAAGQDFFRYCLAHV